MYTIENIKEVYSMLSDDISREIFMARVNFAISDRDYTYLHPIIDKYCNNLQEDNRRYIRDLQERIDNNSKIVLYGAGEDAKANLIFWQKDSRVIAFCDRDRKKQEKGFCGYRVISPEQLLKMQDTEVVICTHRGYEEIKVYLQSKGFPINKIYFMSPFILNMDPEQYFNVDFMNFREEEIFVDAGSYDLGTVIRLKNYCRIKKFYSFEPDIDNLKTCIANKNKFLPDIKGEILPFGTWSKKINLCFSSVGSGSSCIDTEGENSINVIAIDEVVGNDYVTFIKMDVEGAEFESIIGAKKVIRRCRPKLAICIYHKEEDILSIPLKIHEIVPDYKIYIRHHSNGAAETVLYAIP